MKRLGVAVFVLLASVRASATVTTCYNVAALPPPAKITVVQMSPSILRIFFENGFGSDTNEVVTLGEPVVLVSAAEIQVRQLYSVRPTGSGEVPPIGYPLCQRETLDLPALQSGRYTLVWTYTYSGPRTAPPIVRLPFSLPATSVPALGVWGLAALALALVVIGSLRLLC